MAKYTELFAEYLESGGKRTDYSYQITILRSDFGSFVSDIVTPL